MFAYVSVLCFKFLNSVEISKQKENEKNDINLSK